MTPSLPAHAPLRTKVDVYTCEECGFEIYQGLGPYFANRKKVEKEIKEMAKKVNDSMVLELPMLHPEKFVKLGIDPLKGVLCYGLPGTRKVLLARDVARRIDACLICVIGSELVQKYIGEVA